MSAAAPRWWTFRRAQNLSASVYTCPLCNEPLPALAEHMLITPEGNSSGRRHTHVDCFKEARLDGRLPSIDEWKATQPRKPSVWKSLFRR